MTRDVCEVDSERERGREREGEGGREMEWLLAEVWKNIVRSEQQEQKKNCRDNVFISAPLPMWTSIF